MKEKLIEILNIFSLNAIISAFNTTFSTWPLYKMASLYVSNYSVISRNVVLEVNSHDGLCVVI